MNARARCLGLAAILCAAVVAVALVIMPGDQSGACALLGAVSVAGLILILWPDSPHGPSLLLGALCAALLAVIVA